MFYIFFLLIHLRRGRERGGFIFTGVLNHVSCNSMSILQETFASNDETSGQTGPLPQLPRNGASAVRGRFGRDRTRCRGGGQNLDREDQNTLSRVRKGIADLVGQRGQGR